MILVVGASGTLGSEICRRLIARNLPVRALIRPSTAAARVEVLTRMGVELHWGDLKNREQLDSVCAGTRAIVSTASCVVSHLPGDPVESVDQHDQLNLISAAQKAHTRQFIYLTFSCHIDIGDDPSPLTVSTRSTEERLRESGLAYTILRPACIMETWINPSAGFDYDHAHVEVFGQGNKPVSYIALGDVAEFVALAVDNPAAFSTTVELGGPQALSQLDVVRIFEELSGQRYLVRHVSMEALQAERAHAIDPRHKRLAAVRQTLAEGDTIDMRSTLDVFPVTLTTVRDYARRVLT